MHTIRAIGISAKITSPEALRFASEVADGLRERGFEICFDDQTAASLPGDMIRCTTKAQIGQQNDLLITFGGDGTLLSVARHAPSGIPIIGVNMGTLGFLTEIRVEEFPTILESVLEGNFAAEERETFEVTVVNDVVSNRFRVLNDAVINKSALARIIEMRVSVDGRFVSTFRADGLIVSTPTGSTAYNLSAGGPILYPTMSAVVLTPICPHMLSNRPLVLPDNFVIDIEVQNLQSEIVLTLDGQEGLILKEFERVSVRKSEHTALLVSSPDKDYFDVLRTKLKWGEV